MKTDTMSSFVVSWVNNLSAGGEGRGGEEEEEEEAEEEELPETKWA